MKIYTFFGDKGKTKTLQGKILSKDSSLIHINGEIDSLQAQIDRVLLHDIKGKERFRLLNIQKLLWQLGGEISQEGVGGRVNKSVTQEDVLNLEEAIDSMNKNLKGFVRFNNFLSVDINEARVRTRKLERHLTTYKKKGKVRDVSFKFVNRLSDYFFALAVHVQNS